MPTASAPAQFSRRSSTNTHSSGGTPIARRPARRSPAPACACRRRRRSRPRRTAPRSASGRTPGRCPTSSRSARCGCRSACAAAHGVEHRLVGPDPARTAARPGPRLGRPRSRRRTAARTRPRRARPSPACAAAASASGSERNLSLTVSGSRPSRSAERTERLEDVRGEHPAEVDEQALHRRGRQLRDLVRGLGELRHAVVEELEVRVVVVARPATPCSCPP